MSNLKTYKIPAYLLFVIHKRTYIAVLKRPKIRNNLVWFMNENKSADRVVQFPMLINNLCNSTENFFFVKGRKTCGEPLN